MEDALSEYEKSLIQTLRQDAQNLKDCYTRFSFQAIAFTSAILGIIARYQADYPFIALASIASIILLIAVARIGIYKYGSANRLYGYELHLFRTRNLPESTNDGWKSAMRQIGWEEAMRAWRIVQVTVFGELYETKKPAFMRLKKKHRKKSDVYKWFDIKSLAEPEAEYHPGSYLGTINGVLFLLAGLCGIPLTLMAFQLGVSDQSIQWTWFIIPVISFCCVGYFFIRYQVRRNLIESEFLSIHSCAIMWQAVVVAHYRALRKAGDYKNYTKHLVEQANDLSKQVFSIHDWVYGNVNSKKMQKHTQSDYS